MFRNNLLKLKQKMNENNIDLAVITDDDSLYYFTGYYNFLHMDFARPTILLVPKDNDSTLITPLLDVLLIEDDCPNGVKIMHAEASARSSRIMERGGSPYYEYRDTVMSGGAPFRPEWIK